MTPSQRIEAAARALHEAEMLGLHGIEWDEMPDDDIQKVTTRGWARYALEAAYPELHGEKPSHWLAPDEAPMMFMDAHGPSPEEQADGHAYWAEIRLACLEDAQEQG